MKGAPYFKFYPSDFIGGTSDMTQAEVGAYIRLLCAQWQLGGLPSDPDRLCGVAGGVVPPMVLDKLPVDKTDGKRRNLRLELTRQEVTKKIEKLRDNGSKGGKATAVANAVANAAPNATANAAANAQANGAANGVACQMSDVRCHIPQATEQNQTSQPNNTTPARRPRKVRPDGHYPEEFCAFYDVFPVKKGKDAALRAWNKAKHKPPLDIIVAKVHELKASHDWQRDGGRYIPHPASWLNAGGWADEVAKPNTELAF